MVGSDNFSTCVCVCLCVCRRAWMAVARGWTYTQCLVETEATYTRFPGVMGKDRVIRMHSSSSRLQTRHTRAHTELSISRISNTWPRVQQAFLESLGLVNKFEKSVLEQQRPTPRDSFVILSLPCTRSCESIIMFTAASRKKKFWRSVPCFHGKWRI